MVEHTAMPDIPKINKENKKGGKNYLALLINTFF